MRGTFETRRARVTEQLAHERRTVYYSGRVQGVGFRYTAVRAAGSRDVSGFVQNLPDGRVLLVAEGRADELDRLLETMAQRLGRYIENQQVRVEAATGEFVGFDVRY